MPRIRAWHATSAVFDKFAPYSHFGTRAQAEMRRKPSGRLIEVEVLLLDMLRKKDTGSWSRQSLVRLDRKGYDGITYLNRYEGLSLASVERAEAKHANLNRLTDAQFQKTIPEAADSWIIFNPAHVQIVSILEASQLNPLQGIRALA